MGGVSGRKRREELSLNELAIRYLSLSQLGMIGINWLVIVAGGILGWLTWKGEKSLRRVSYLLIFAILLFVFTVMQTLWLLAPQAIVDGQIWFIFLVMMLTSLAYGYGTWIIASARSRDVITDGNPGIAAYAFVPLANLYLIFARGEARTSGDDIEQPRSRFGRFVGDPLLVILALCIIGAGNVVTRAGTERATSTSSASSTTEAQALGRMAETVGVSATMDRLAADMRLQLPMTIDELTQLVSVVSAHGQLTYDYDISQPVTLRPDFGQDLIRQACQPHLLGPVLAAGGSIRQRYSDPNGTVILDQFVTGADCNRF